MCYTLGILEAFYMCDKPDVDPKVRNAQCEQRNKEQAKRDAASAADFMSCILGPFIEGSSSDKTPRRKA